MHVTLLCFTHGFPISSDSDQLKPLSQFRGPLYYSVSGTGMQCRWDTTRHGAVWVPDDCAMDNIKCQLDLDDTSKKIDLADPAVVEAIDKAERDYCKSVLNEYNAWLAGDCHGAVVYVINRETGRRLKSQDEECWGFIGETYAKEHLEDEMIGVAQRLIDKGLDDLSAINIH